MTALPLGQTRDRGLRVLIAHNAYQYRGGEDAVVEAETALLRKHGHEVELYQRDHAELATTGKLPLALQAFWSPKTSAAVSAAIRDFKPDLIHVHNTVPLISPAIYWVAARARVPVVQTLHNFRLLCPQALLLREGRVCEDCVGKVPWRGVMHGCYRDSAAQTAVLAASNTAHRVAGTWRDKVTRYIALNEFARAKFAAGGLPVERIRVKPNFVDLPNSPETSRQGLLFVGRLSEEKGVETLLAVARRLPEGLRIRVAGVGPLSPQVAAEPRIECLGALSQEDVYTEMRRAQLLLVPSICYESFPRTVVEAYACSLPVLASELGAFPEIVRPAETGWLVRPGDEQAWVAAICNALERGHELQLMGRQARRHYELALSAAPNYERLMEIYQEACSELSPLER